MEAVQGVAVMPSSSTRQPQLDPAPLTPRQHLQVQQLSASTRNTNTVSEWLCIPNTAADSSCLASCHLSHRAGWRHDSSQSVQDAADAVWCVPDHGSYSDSIPDRRRSSHCHVGRSNLPCLRLQLTPISTLDCITQEGRRQANVTLQEPVCPEELVSVASHSALSNLAHLAISHPPASAGQPLHALL